MLRYGNRTLQDYFNIAYEALLGCDTFTLSLASLTNIVCGPGWFKKEFLATKVEDEANKKQ